MSRDDLSLIIDFSLSSLQGSLNDGSSLLLHLLFAISVYNKNNCFSPSQPVDSGKPTGKNSQSNIWKCNHRK